jgi:hypothetical protein
MGEVRNKCRILEGNLRGIVAQMLDVVVEFVLRLCFYNKNLHYSAIAHEQLVSSSTLFIPFERNFPVFIRGFKTFLTK